MNRREIGTQYETLAAALLIKSGYRILCRNYRTRRAEIDLIAEEGNALVFIEVKYRKDARYGTPSEAVGKEKQRRIKGAALSWLSEQGGNRAFRIRFDVVEILGDQYRILRDAF